MYRKNGFIDAWQAPSIADREPIHQRAAGIAVVSQSPVGTSEVVIRDNSLRDMRPTETRQVAYVAFRNDAGVSWTVPAVEAPWSQVVPREHFLGSQDIDFVLQKVRVEVSVGATTVAGAVIKAQYAHSPTGPWADLCSATLDAGTNKTFYAAYSNLSQTLSHAPAYIRIVGSKGTGTASAMFTQIVVRFCRDGDAPRSLADTLAMARIPEGAGEPHARTTSAPTVQPTDRFLVLRPGVQRAILPRASSLIKTVVLLNKSGGNVGVIANEGRTARGARFDGSTYIDFARTGLSGLPANLQKFTVAFWVSFDTFANWNFLLSSFATAKGVLDICTLGSPAALQILGRNGTGVVVLDQRTATDVFAAGTLYHVLLSCDLTQPVIKLRINGQQAAWRTTGYTPVLTANGTIVLDSTNLRLGARSSAATPTFAGNLAQLWFEPNLYVDLDVQSNVDKFFAGGLAVNLGYNGWRPTGNPPALFLNADGGAFRINQAKTIESGTSTGTLQAPTLIVPGQETPYTIDGDGPLYTLLDGRSASFTTIDEGTEINKYARLGGV
jgi:Concanavalin A-like lectin/glucanases superfamily